jgi:hypothetical protein
MIALVFSFIRGKNNLFAASITVAVNDPGIFLLLKQLFCSCKTIQTQLNAKHDILMTVYLILVMFLVAAPIIFARLKQDGYT